MNIIVKCLICLVCFIYIVPVTVSIIYVLVQKMIDNNYRAFKDKIFKESNQLKQCILISLTPFINFIPVQVCLKTIYKSIIGLLNENLGD